MPYKDPAVAKQKRKEKYWRDPDGNRAKSLEWHYANPEKARAQGKKYRAEHPDRVLAEKTRWRSSGRRRESEDRSRLVNPKFVWIRLMLNGAKYRAKKKGVGFALTLEQMRKMDLPDVCPYLGLRLVYTGSGHGKTGPHAHSPSIDRIDPSRGYTIDNIEIISNRANALKGNGTAEEHEKIAARLRKLERLRADDPLLRTA